MIAKIILILITLLSSIIATKKHGKPRPKYDKNSALVGFVVLMTLYYFAGIFDFF